MEQKVRKGEELNEINLKNFLKENDLISDILMLSRIKLKLI